MLDAARQSGAKILCPSAFEWNQPIARARAWAAGKKILSYGATNSFDDYPSHGVHGVYLIHRVVAENGNPLVSVAYRSASWHNPPGVMTFEHRDAAGRPFFGTLHQVGGGWGSISIQTPEETGGKSFEIPAGDGVPFNRTELWAPTIWAYQDMALNGVMPETYEQIETKTRAFLAGFHSILERSGGPVRLDEIPERWCSPVDTPTHADHTQVELFRRKFGSEMSAD